jgi:hypothetical protein
MGFGILGDYLFYFVDALSISLNGHDFAISVRKKDF